MVLDKFYVIQMAIWILLEIINDTKSNSNNK